MGDLKEGCAQEMPRNLTDLEHFAKKSGQILLSQDVAMLIDSYPKRLSGVIKSKGGFDKVLV